MLIGKKKYIYFFFLHIKAVLYSSVKHFTMQGGKCIVNNNIPSLGNT